jgi:DNA-binding NtrC family response regulator
MDYPFPGNVRELRNIVIRLTTKYAGQTIGSDALVSELDWEEPSDAEPAAPAQDFKTSLESARRYLQGRKGFNLDQVLRELERSYVEAALEITQGNLSQAARLLGIHRTTLYSRMQAYEQPAQDTE